MDLIKDIRHKESLAYFPLPDQIDPYMQSFLEDACRQLCEWFAKTEKIGPLPDLNCIPAIPPKISGLSTTELLKDLQVLMDGSYHPSHPGALAHLDPPPLTASIVGDLICAGLNNNLLAEELSPSLSKLERNLCKWISTRFGLPDTSGGVAASGGSLTNLMGLVLARYKSDLLFDPSAVLFASEDAHVSISRALRVMGLPPDSFIPIDTDQQGRLSINSLEREFKTAKAKGKKSFAVVATAGTTVCGAVDPLLNISQFCLSEGLWLHVDAAIGGAYALSETTKQLINGIQMANSVTFNPQKLLGIGE